MNCNCYETLCVLNVEQKVRLTGDRTQHLKQENTWNGKTILFTYKNLDFSVCEMNPLTLDWYECYTAQISYVLRRHKDVKK